MTPTISDGDMLVVDRSRIEVREADKIWAFGYGSQGMIKRLRRHAKGGYRFTSDNKVVDPFDADEIHLVGRIVGIMCWQ